MRGHASTDDRNASVPGQPQFPDSWNARRADFSDSHDIGDYSSGHVSDCGDRHERIDNRARFPDHGRNSFIGRLHFVGIANDRDSEPSESRQRGHNNRDGHPDWQLLWSYGHALVLDGFADGAAGAGVFVQSGSSERDRGHSADIHPFDYLDWAATLFSAERPSNFLCAVAGDPRNRTGWIGIVGRFAQEKRYVGVLTADSCRQFAFSPGLRLLQQ